jgi:hypothetical protein
MRPRSWPSPALYLAALSGFAAIHAPFQDTNLQAAENLRKSRPQTVCLFSRGRISTLLLQI